MAVGYKPANGKCSKNITTMNRIDKSFLDSVNEQDLVRVRLVLGNMVIYNPCSGSLRDMLQLAMDSFPSLFETHDNKPFEKDVANWTVDLLYSVHIDLDTNFSKERWDYIMELCKYVSKERIEALEMEELQNEAEDKLRMEMEQSKARMKQVYTGVTLGGAVMVVAGLCFSKASLTVLGAAGVLIGGVLLYNKSRS